MQLPAPPLLKTTIIQLNKDIDPEDNNYEILTNEYSNNSLSVISSQSPAISEEQPRKKRRRSSSFVDEDELMRRRNETKQLHSIIEKRRRIKINREFEALKYLIPACRSTENTTKRGASSNNNSNKIDGMYKLTILKSAVEYILYLHFIVQKQHRVLSLMIEDYSYDATYSTVPLDVNQYRNIDKEFDFAALSSKIPDKPTLPSTKSWCEPIREQNEEAHHPASQYQQPRNFSLHGQVRSKSDTLAGFGRPAQLPTPDVTPDIAPILSVLSRYASSPNQKTSSQSQITSSQSQEGQLELKRAHSRHFLLHDTIQPNEAAQDLDSLKKTFLFDHPVKKSGSVSSSTSPFTIPIKSQIKRAQFYLPDPALSGTSSESTELPVSVPQALPKKMYFKSKVPSSNMVANVGSSEVDIEAELNDSDRLKDASKTLLTLRKPSIEKLLN